MNRILLITGEKGAGKSTLVQKSLDFCMKNFPFIEIRGFFTCIEGETLTFRIIGNNNIIIIAERKEKMKPLAEGFNEAALLLKEIDCKGKFLLMDELGYLESDFPYFQEEVLKLINEAKFSILVVRKMSTPFLDKIRRLKESEIIEVTPQYRDPLPERVKEFIILQVNNPKNSPHKE